jgi:hypothetical protein
MSPASREPLVPLVGKCGQSQDVPLENAHLILRFHELLKFNEQRLLFRI